MNKNVIYTSLVGKYDSLTNPKYIMPNWDYICFSNNIKKSKDSIWEIRPIPFQHSDNTILSRYPKINPHLVLPEYEYSLYIDANIEFLDDFIERRVNDLISKNTLLSAIPHPNRNCIYQEAQICITGGLETRKQIEKQIEFLREEKFPENNGLFENGLILRRHNTPLISSMGNEWWNLYLRYSKRDQLSFGYVLWKKNINCEEFTTKGLSVRNIPSINYNLHKRTFIQKAKRFFQRKINKYI